MSDNRDRALTDLTSIITVIEAKLSELTIDLEVAKRNLAILKHDDESVKSVSSASNCSNRPRRSKRDKATRSRSKAQSIPAHSNHIFIREDRIKVLNPSNKEQTVEGRVTGHTRNGFVKFTLDNGISTVRKPTNLILIKKAS